MDDVVETVGKTTLSSITWLNFRTTSKGIVLLFPLRYALFVVDT
jgi:hypothetical protein